MPSGRSVASRVAETQVLHLMEQHKSEDKCLVEGIMVLKRQLARHGKAIEQPVEAFSIDKDATLAIRHKGVLDLTQHRAVNDEDGNRVRVAKP
jgi:hypothetical protein